MPSENFVNGNGHEPEPKRWKNSNVLFCHSSIDDAKIPKGAMRVLLHLQRRVGRRTERNANLNPGIESMAETCKMEKDSVEGALRWLKPHGYIEVGKVGRSNHYKVLVPQSKLYIDPRLDDSDLSPVKIRLLAHMARLCGNNVGTKRGIAEGFCINKSEFAKVCDIDRKTVGRALEYLYTKEFYCGYHGAENPIYGLFLSDLFPRTEAA